MRFACIGVLAAIVAPLSVPGAEAATECAPRPETPVGAAVTVVGADRVEPPAVTAPIAVLDSGVTQAPEFSGRLRAGSNVVTGGSNTADLDGHGSAVASIAAAAAGGIRGISPTSPLIPIKILDARGETSAEDVVTGIRRALFLGARVINISAAAPAGGSDPGANRLVEGAIWAAVTKGAVVIAPTGNEGRSPVDIPAAYAHVIAVGATDEANTHAAFSNTGVAVDLAAPGVNLTVVAPPFLCSTGYALVSGTSFAAPAVSGTAALLLAKHPELDPTQVADMLRLRGISAPAPGWDLEVGFGLLDVPAVLAAPIPGRADPEVNDTIAWARRHAAVLVPAMHKATLRGHLARHLDPVDTYRVRLKSGDRLRAKLAMRVGSATLSVANRRRTLAQGSPASVRIKRSGEYYVSVSLKSAPPAGTSYTLGLQR